MKRILKFVFLLSIIVLLWGIFIYSFLAKTEEVPSEILILEGWVHEGTMDFAVEKYKSGNFKYLITTGGPITGNNFLLSTNSALKVLNNKGYGYPLDSTSTIVVNAIGSAIEDKYAHFRLYVNDSEVGDSYTTGSLKSYDFKVPTKHKDIFSVAVFFDNDEVKKGEDRNLIIESITINGVVYKPFDEGTTHDFHRNNKIESQEIHRTMAESARFALIKKGIDEGAILSVPAPLVKYDRTFESAAAVATFLNEVIPDKKEITIVSEGVHSRRSQMMYKKAFGKSYNVGVIAVESGVNSPDWWKSLHGIREVFVQFGKYLYAQFIFYLFA